MIEGAQITGKETISYFNFNLSVRGANYRIYGNSGQNNNNYMQKTWAIKKADKDSNEEIDRVKGAKSATKNIREKEAKREIKMQVK